MILVGLVVLGTPGRLLALAVDDQAADRDENIYIHPMFSVSAVQEALGEGLQRCGDTRHREKAWALQQTSGFTACELCHGGHYWTSMCSSLSVSQGECWAEEPGSPQREPAWLGVE